MSLLASMALLMDTFDTYAAADGKKDTLSKSEVKTLLEKEFLPQGAMNQGEVDKLLKDLDLNGDEEVDFTEFMVLVTSLTLVCRELSCCQAPKK